MKSTNSKRSLKFSQSSNYKHLVFVVHLHHATSLHYDFRLQIGDVMPSWAIPKGPTLDPKMKRLAMETPDHSMEYRKFEGVLPEGSYGAGPVIIWDAGEYCAQFETGTGKDKKLETVCDIDEANKIMKEGMKKGEIKFELHGKRLKGSFALVKTRGFGPKNSWLLIKHKDEYVKENFDANDLKTSVVSGKALEDMSF